MDLVSLISTSRISRLIFKSKSVKMEKKTHSRIKPLQTGQQLFSWFCPGVIDESLNKYQTLARQIFQFTFAVIFAAITVVSNLSLLTKHTSTNDLAELFFELSQLIEILHDISVIIATFALGSKLASLFRNLEDIYNACKAENNV